MINIATKTAQNTEDKQERDEKSYRSPDSCMNRNKDPSHENDRIPSGTTFRDDDDVPRVKSVFA